MDELNERMNAYNHRTSEAFESLYELHDRSRQAFDDLNDRTHLFFDNVFDNLGMVSRQAVDNLETQLGGLSGELEQLLRQSSEAAHTTRNSREEAEGLRRLINLLLKQAIEGNAELASVHELSVRQASTMASDEYGALASLVASAAASSAALQEQIVSDITYMVRQS